MPGLATSRTDALDVISELLSELDDDVRSDVGAFYNRICEAVCRLTSMERAGLFLYDDARKLVVPVGCHGVDPALLANVHGTLEETPVARRALEEDRVVEVSHALEREVPARYARFAGITTLTCTPVAAAGRWLGVIFADRGGGHFVLTEEERHAMWTLGKTAALAATARRATSQQGLNRLLSSRIELAREIHERVVQRLFGVSLALGRDGDLSDGERQRCTSELQAAVGDLRSVLSRPLEAAIPVTATTLRAELARLGRHYKDLPVEVTWNADVPAHLEPLAQYVLAEALRNADKHARPTAVAVEVDSAGGAFTLEVRNDGAGGGLDQRGAQMGLRLAAMEALRLGGVLEFGPAPGDRWRVRLIVPLEEAP